ncbi:hypothetical protein [Streptomyces cinnamoneus]|uniref:Uncharacterized protein n=1 Tax=Streptomyces cinnamoneus TaxID=53446 RepID=A0A918TWM2_STRCJ|nr:hypothetical protein [Streptomyces cinnamoneus]GHC65028.1 hypothetical protein GCM10010507_48160 [Streptomyces cinnamoneus]
MAAMCALSPPRLPGPVRRALLVGAALLTLGAAGGAARSAIDPPQSHCGDPRSAQFPLGSRLSGGPRTYERGGSPQTWRLELRNTTDAACRDVHPVAVLSDKGRALEPGHIHLDFYDADGARWLPVAFERTDEAENVGVLGGGSPQDASGFPGFVVPPHGTVTVPLRLAFAGNTPAGPVTANVTAVQKRGDDGAWVGESDDYTFAVEPGRPGVHPERPGVHPGRTHRAAAPGGNRGNDDAPPALADTGDALPLYGIGATACALLAGGTALVLGMRAVRRRTAAVQEEVRAAAGVRRPPGADH